MPKLIDACRLVDCLPVLAEDKQISLFGAIADFVVLISEQPTIEAETVRHGRWILEAHDERVNCRWNVTAECSECCDEKKEIYAEFFPGVPAYLAKDVILGSAKSVKLSNYCPTVAQSCTEVLTMYLIDRGKLLMQMMHKFHYELPDGCNNSLYGDVIKVIEDASLIEAEPVRHGRWVAKPQMYRHPNAKNYYCSECREETGACGNFCPNCGCKMSKEEE